MIPVSGLSSSLLLALVASSLKPGLGNILTFAMEDPSVTRRVDMAMKHLLVNRNYTKVSEVAGLLSMLDLAVEVIGDLGGTALGDLLHLGKVIVSSATRIRDILLSFIIEVRILGHTKLGEHDRLGKVTNQPRVC